MIKNERQYRISLAEALRFQEALTSRPDDPPAESGIHPRLWAAEREAMVEQLSSLEGDLAAFDALRAGTRRVFAVSALADLPRALIEGRIASGLTQRDLAGRLKLPEQAIQRYEATDYSSASLERLVEVANAIGVTISGAVALTEAAQPSLKHFFAKLKSIGFDRSFVLERLLPPQVSSSLGSKGGKESAGALFHAATVISRLLGIVPEQLWNDDPLQLDLATIGGARFKRASSTRKRVDEGYVFFAHYLGLLTLQCTEHLQRKPWPATAPEWRAAILSEFGSLQFEHVLRFYWKLGIPVLPLRDSGHFHGACWRISGREVVVLKQRSLSQDRWTFDALHEGGHIVDEPPDKPFAVIEEQFPSGSSPAEERATDFAANVILGGKAQDLAEKAVEISGGDIRRLERATQQVADAADVPVGALANYLAFRISRDTADDPRPINWWGTADRLQHLGVDPWRIARDVFLDFADLGRLNPSDRELLGRTLRDLDDVSKLSNRRSRNA